MSANQTLNKLVSQMDIEDRLSLLEKIRKNLEISSEPLYVSKEGDGQGINFEDQYWELSWFARLLYRIIGAFTGRAAPKAYEHSRMLAMARRIEATAPGVYDYRQDRLLEGFHAALLELKEAARFFYTVLDTSINNDRGAFYAILGSLEMGPTHERLQNDCTPLAVMARDPDLQPSGVKQAVLRAMEDALQQIPESKRGAMYYHARSLGYLRELSCFLFDRFLLGFAESPAGGHRCPTNVQVKEMLCRLDDILFSLRDPPAVSLLESLFVYDLETRVGEPGFDMDREMAQLLETAGKSLATIRGFNTKIPLTRIIRCVARNPEYLPAQIGGGEDWFQVYRGYWKQQIEDSLAEYSAQKKRQDIIDSLDSFFDERPEPLANAASEAAEGGFPLQEAFALSFLKAFHAVLQARVNNVLRPILVDGEFSRREDRVGLTESYNDVMFVAARVQVLDDKIAPEGELGKRYSLAKQETDTLAGRRRKMQITQNDASKEAWDIIARASDGMKKMAFLLEGILAKAPPTGDNVCLTNYDKLSKKNPVAFVDGIRSVIDIVSQGVKVLDDISAMGGKSL